MRKKHRMTFVRLPAKPGRRAGQAIFFQRLPRVEEIEQKALKLFNTGRFFWERNNLSTQQGSLSPLWSVVRWKWRSPRPEFMIQLGVNSVDVRKINTLVMKTAGVGQIQPAPVELVRRLTNLVLLKHDNLTFLFLSNLIESRVATGSINQGINKD